MFQYALQKKANKCVIQQEAYRPLVARITQHALLSGGGGCLLPEGGGVSGPGAGAGAGMSAPGGGVYPSMYWGRPPLLWTESQTHVKS